MIFKGECHGMIWGLPDWRITEPALWQYWDVKARAGDCAGVHPGQQGRSILPKWNCQDGLRAFPSHIISLFCARWGTSYLCINLAWLSTSSEYQLGIVPFYLSFSCRVGNSCMGKFLPWISRVEVILWSLCLFFLQDTLIIAKHWVILTPTALLCPKKAVVFSVRRGERLWFLFDMNGHE